MTALRIAGFALVAGLSASAPQSNVCGCALAPPAGASVFVAEESAIIVWDAATKTQHFIRRAQFDTKAKDFGFLVPTPARPVLSEVDDSVFGYLVDLTRPPVREVARQEVAKGEGPPPAASLAPAPAVIVLESVTVAGLDAVVLEANDAQALNRWLRDHGYSSSPELAEWFKPYVSAKWILTAFKISKGESRAERAVTSAVRMSFKTDKPFFPYREPATGNSNPRALEVYFVSGERVEGRIGAAGERSGTMLDRMVEMLGFGKGANGNWPGRTLWAKPLSAESRKELLDRMKLPSSAAPPTVWLTRFLDPSAPRPGTDELYFSRASDQSQFLDADRLTAELERKRSVKYSYSETAHSGPRTRSEREADRDTANALYQKALSIEASDPNGAIRIYRRAARDGDGKAAKRLGEIFDKGIPGVTRNYEEALSWYSKARELGETIELSGKR